MEPRPRLAGSVVRYTQELNYHGRNVPAYVEEEFEAYLKCGRLEHGFLRVRCTTCHAERLVTFSCKRRGFCPSCGARRMTESAALLVDAVLPRVPIRQWVLSVPFPLGFLFVADPAAMGQVFGDCLPGHCQPPAEEGRADAVHRPDRCRDAVGCWSAWP